ncbi:MAG: alpha-ketoglutarate-dependent dioxygenase AlkB [Pirellulaceae bacterium]|nr:alpha-ketoglutarate-dependent dioxygenase AlkB [Pirellulaceae bacterium]
MLQLTGGGIMLLEDAFIPAKQAEEYFTALRNEVDWQQKPGLFGHPQPRLIAAYGDPGVMYRYSGHNYPALPWTTTLLEIKRQIEAIKPIEAIESIEAFQGQYNYCLLNLYRHGSDSMGWHADDEPEMGHVIGSLSLGATRKFRIRHKATGETKAFDAANGTLIIMAGTMQQHWQHEVPKTKRVVGERINLTFRQIHRPVPPGR